MNLESIVQYMQTQGLGSPGRDLFAYGMPDGVNRGLLVTSQMPILRNKYVSQLRRGEFQVIARGSLHADLINTLNSVSNALTVQGVTIGTMNFRFIMPLNNPLVFPRAESRLLEASVNFEFAFTQPA
jgi:hypothetical protein